MIPNVSVTVYRFVQDTITVIAVQLKLVGFHYGLSFRLSIPCHWMVGDPIVR